jgi:hypothetical protein
MSLVFKINGQEVSAPRNWQDIEVLATFDRASVQANISTTEFSFVNDAARVIIDHIEGGFNNSTNGIFEGLDAEISVSEDAAFGLPVQTVFKGYIDLTRTEIVAPNEVSVFFEDERGLDKLEFKAEGLTFGLMKDKGWITDNDFVDIPYVYQKPNDLIGQALLAIAIYEMVKQVASVVKEVGKAISDIGGGITGVIVSAAKILLLLTYFGVLIFQLVILLQELKSYLIPDIRYYKGMQFRKMLEKGLSFMGYTLSSTISQLDTFYLLPTKKREGQEIPLFQSTVDDGIPSLTDSGYIFSEFLQNVLTMFNAKIQIDENNVVNIESLNNDSFWIQQATFELPDVLRESYNYNTEELAATNLTSFAVDYSDAWTLENYTGTNYEVKTEMIAVSSEQRNLLKGLKQNSIPYALGSRKDSLTKVENAFVVVLGLFDSMINALDVIGAFPPSGLAANFNERLGVLRLSEQFTSVPKALVLEQTSDKLLIPTNARDLLSARALWERYLNKQSFVDNDFGGQYQIFKGIRVPFTLADFIKLKENSYFYDTDGARAKVDKISWRIGDDYAVLDYRKEFVYTRNLKERKIEGNV